ncbi:MAG: SAM-dependent chlorinase/fluorinase [Conexivisphaerales archaeon]
MSLHRYLFYLSYIIEYDLLIGLITDFGIQDQYVFQLKAVIRSITDCEVVDITHLVPPFSIETGAFLLLQASKYAPRGSILVGVVDPGVGGSRKCIAVKTKREIIFVGPDNGLMWEAINHCGYLEAREITSEKYYTKKGGTFDGRDVFAPAAAHLAEGMSFEDIGPKLPRIEQLKFPEPKITKSLLHAYVLHTDRFGNSILNITAELFHRWAANAERFCINASGESFFAKLYTSYSQMKGRGLITGSTGLLELSSFKPQNGGLKGKHVFISKMD